MKKINIYITEKLQINKDVNTEESFDIDYESTAITKTDFLNYYIFNKTPVKKFETKKLREKGLITTFNIKVFNKDDYLWLLVSIYDRVANEARNIKEDFDKKMKETVSQYTKKYKDNIHSLFTIDDIYDRYIEFRKRNNIR